jgi:hypothetical protein
MVKLVTILFIIAVVGGFLFLKFHSSLPFSPQGQEKQSVKGVQTSILGTQIQQTLNALHQQVTQLSPKDISSSSPQVQAILHTLQQLPAGEAHDVCQKLCGEYLK